MKNLPWLVTISSGLGDSIQALVAIKQIICKAEQHPVFLVCDKHLYPLFSDLEGPTKIFSFQLDLNKIKNFQYDWVIDFASIDWSFNLCKDLVYFHYARHEFYSKPILLEKLNFYNALFPMDQVLQKQEKDFLSKVQIIHTN